MKDKIENIRQSLVNMRVSGSDLDDIMNTIAKIHYQESLSVEPKAESVEGYAVYKLVNGIHGTPACKDLVCVFADGLDADAFMDANPLRDGYYYKVESVPLKTLPSVKPDQELLQQAHLMGQEFADRVPPSVSAAVADVQTLMNSGDKDKVNE